MTIGVAPSFTVFGAELAWHGVFAGLGIGTAYVVAWILAPRFRVERAPLDPLLIVLAVAGIIGTRLWYLVENDPGNLLTPWRGGREGFSFWGAVIGGGLAAVLYLRRRRLPLMAHLDLVALAFLAGMAVGRVADLLNGEHYGPPTGLPWGIAYSDPAAHVPEVGVMYHSGALYEILAALILFTTGLVIARRLTTPGLLFWLVLSGYAASRFLIFFVVRDADVVAFGLRQAQLTGIPVFVVAAAGLVFTVTRREAFGRRAPATR